jgi:hypothetical protein
MTNPHAYDWRAAQPDEPSILLPDGRVLEPLNLGAILPKEPQNPLARLIVSQTPMRKMTDEHGNVIERVGEIVDAPLPLGALELIARAKKAWALKGLKAQGVL